MKQSLTKTLLLIFLSTILFTFSNTRLINKNHGYFRRTENSESNKLPLFDMSNYHSALNEEKINGDAVRSLMRVTDNNSLQSLPMRKASNVEEINDSDSSKEEKENKETESTPFLENDSSVEEGQEKIEGQEEETIVDKRTPEQIKEDIEKDKAKFREVEKVRKAELKAERIKEAKRHKEEMKNQIIDFHIPDKSNLFSKDDTEGPKKLEEYEKKVKARNERIIQRQKEKASKK